MVVIEKKPPPKKIICQYNNGDGTAPIGYVDFSLNLSNTPARHGESHTICLMLFLPERTSATNRVFNT